MIAQLTCLNLPARFYMVQYNFQSDNLFLEKIYIYNVLCILYVLECTWECVQYVQHIQLRIINIGKM